MSLATAIGAEPKLLLSAHHRQKVFFNFRHGVCPLWDSSHKHSPVEAHAHT